MSLNKQIVLDSRPTEKVSPANFRLVEAPLPDAGPGRSAGASPLSLARPLHARPAQRREILRQAAGTGRDDGRRNGRRGRRLEQSALRAGRFRRRHGRLAALWPQRRARSQRVDAKAIPLQAYLGPVGMPGVTAWYGLNKIIAPKAGETVARLRRDRRGRLGGRPARQARRRAGDRRRGRRGEMRLCDRASSATTPASTTSRRASPRS